MAKRFRRYLVVSLDAPRSIFLAGFLLLSGPSHVHAQSTAESPQALQSDSSQNAPKPTSEEIVSHDTPTTFRVGVNLVLVRVVVRDSSGKAVSNLKKEDFQLTDNRKVQSISSFSVETPASRAVQVAADSAEKDALPAVPKTVTLPQRYVGLFFDDVHLLAQDVMDTRRATAKLFAALQPSDRIAIFTTSGEVEQDFTVDRRKLEDTLQHIGPRGVTSHSSTDCPPISLYEAHLIVDVHDSLALSVGVQDAIACGIPPQIAPMITQTAAQRQLNVGETELQISFSNLASLIRRMSALPGERSIVLISPGFFMTPSMHESSDMIDRAARGNIVINTIDARGLYVSAADADLSSRRCATPECQNFIRTEESLQNGVLAELADGTGGLFIHNRNDIDNGLLEAAAAPETSYLLGFSPQNLKSDGKYHQLKVSLTNKEKFTLQARHGYFAPSKESAPAGPVVAGNDDVQQAIYSQEERHDLTVDCRTQFAKLGENVRLSVFAFVDLKGLRFRKAQDRNDDDLTVATAVFDDNGNLVTGLQRNISLKLKDATLEQLKKTGISVKSEFTVTPGTYLVRLVVRDSEGEQIGAMNRGVVIPR